MVDPLIALVVISLAAGVPQSHDDLLAAGGKAYDAGRYAEAAEKFKSAAEKKPTADAFTALGHAHAALRNGAEARAAYGKALASRPVSVPRLKLWMARTWLVENAPAAALDTLAEAAAAPETAVEALPLYAQALEQAGRAALAVDAYKTALFRLPSNTVLAQRIVSLLIDLGRAGEAAHFARALVDQSPADPEARLFQAQAALSAGDLDAAEAALDAARFLGSPRPSLARTLADLRLSRGQARDAAALYERFLASAEKPAAEDLRRAGLAYLQGGELESAERMLVRARDEGGAPQHEGLVSLARALHDRRGPREALAALDRVFRADSRFAPVFVLRGEIHAAAGHWEEARQALAAAYELGERGPTALAWLLTAQLQSRRRSEAAALLPEALALHPEHPPLRKILDAFARAERP